MYGSKLLLLAVVFHIITCAFTEEATIKTLVLLDSFLVKETHSQFFGRLRDRGHAVTYKAADDANLALIRYGDLLYDNLIVFAPNVDEFGGSVNKKAILDFVDAGGNLLVATGHKAGSVVREIAAECGIEVDVPGNIVIDHFNYDTSDPSHTLFSVDSTHLSTAQIMVGKNGQFPLLYQGAGLLVNTSNLLLHRVLTAPCTAYTANPDVGFTSTSGKSALMLAGKDITLVAAVQTRNNARVLFSGSMLFFADAAIYAPVTKPNGVKFQKSGNENVVDSLSRWVFKETGVIRVKSVSHHKVGEFEPPMEYTITDDVVFTMELEHKENNEWVPFSTNDLQLEFVRIDPFVRATVPSTGPGNYSIVFKLPDVYGVFKFLVDYRRVGYTTVFSSTIVSVRPLKHTQYERFIASAYPYYASAFSMMAGVFLFSFVFLHASLDKEKSA